ncbi:MAG: class II aldolase/adducin family protein [Paracoccaceae bacterium]|jgi:ribulose-5-phosphate 4-epimerase/fuculose-1-phosphate aldolase|nr:class II aldolase/adducin family protein [Paracoccaceae bacterium]
MSGSPAAELVTASRILVAQGVLDAFGHVSLRDPGDPSRFWLSTARPPSAVTEDDFLQFDLSAEPVEATDAPLFSEGVLHAAIYAARPGAMAVVHHHAPALMPFCIGAGRLYPVTQTGGFMGGAVPVWDSADAFGATNMLVTTMEQARALAAALGDRPLVLMRGHGATLAAGDLRELVFMAVYSAREAEHFLRAAAFAPPVPLSAGEVALTCRPARPAIDRGWEHWVATLPADAKGDSR